VQLTLVQVPFEQDCPAHTPPALQTPHGLPPLPHATATVPAWQTSYASQQPDPQFTGPHPMLAAQVPPAAGPIGKQVVPTHGAQLAP